MCRHLRVMLLALLSLAAGQAVAEDIKLCVNRFGGNVRAPGPLGQCLKWERVLTIPTGGGGPSFQYKIGDTNPTTGGIVFFVDYHDQYPGFDYLEAAPDKAILAPPYMATTTIGVRRVIARMKLGTRPSTKACSTPPARLPPWQFGLSGLFNPLTI